MVASGPADGPDPRQHVAIAPRPSNAVMEPGHVFDVPERTSPASRWPSVRLDRKLRLQYLHLCLLR